jgi:hypothetical protein
MMNDTITKAIHEVDTAIEAQIRAIAAGRSTSAMCLAFNSLVATREILLAKQSPAKPTPAPKKVVKVVREKKPTKVVVKKKKK